MTDTETINNVIEYLSSDQVCWFEEANAIKTLLTERDSLQAQLDTAKAENARLEKLVYVPGLLKCAKCKFSQISTVLDAGSGQAYANSSPGNCLNGCGPLWRVTERDAGNEMVDRCEALQAQSTRAPDEWKLLPKQLTEPMREVLLEMLTNCHSVDESYEDLLDAAPLPASETTRMPGGVKDIMNMLSTGTHAEYEAMDEGDREALERLISGSHLGNVFDGLNNGRPYQTNSLQSAIGALQVDKILVNKSELKALCIHAIALATQKHEPAQDASAEVAFRARQMLFSNIAPDNEENDE